MNGNEANAEALQFSPSPLIQNGSVGVVDGYDQVGAASLRQFQYRRTA